MPIIGKDKDKEPDPKAPQEPTPPAPATEPAPTTPVTPATPAEDQPAPPPAQPDAEKMDAEEFRQQQEIVARSQNLNATNAVPEQRPQAFLEPPPESDLTKRLREEGALGQDEEPMPASAFEKARSDAQMKESAKNSVSEALHVGSVAKATDGPHKGRYFAITRVEEYETQEDLVNVAAGRPEQRFAHPARIEGSARGDERDGEVLILDADEAGLEIVRDWTNRRMR